MSAEAKALKIDAGAQRGSPAANGILQRKCACGGSPGISGDCKECQGKRLQRKLTIGASNDPLEQEADRVADQVMAAPAHSEMSSTPLRIQRYSSQATQGADTAPVSVDRVLASSGSPLEPALRQNMEQRFGHDFSRVRVHSGREAGKSARDVDSKAYTVGHNIVFGAGQFTPGTRDGQLLIAHELTHVVQQSPPTLARFSQKRGVANGTMPATGIAAHCGQMLIQRADGSEYRGSGGKSGGGGATDGWEDGDSVQRMFPAWTKMSLPSTLEFYHGTRWSVAQNIGRIEPRGIGDFAAGFYTHFEPENNPAALNRAKERGRWAASQDPKEPYAGVLNFKIPAKPFIKLLNTRSRVFPLRDLKQSDYPERQREWLSYITTHGRESTPQFFADQHNVERWRHYELQSPSVPSNALTIGPFYTPRQGLPGQPPPRSEFQPNALEPATAPTRLQQQVAWAEEGIDLLNASPRLALQFDRKTGAPVDPPIPATVAPPQISERYTSQNPSDE